MCPETCHRCLWSAPRPVQHDVAARALDRPVTNLDVPTWQAARHLLGDYQGEASELFVIDIPGERLDRVLSAIAALPDVVVEVCAGENLEPPAALDDQLLARLAAPTPNESQHAFCSGRGTSEHLQVYVWTPAGTGHVDLELVFWNDLSFARDLTEPELSRRLDRLVGLAEACRGENSSSRCILSTEHNGDPRELLSLSLIHI